MKSKIVIIGANSFQNPLIEKAKEMGFETHVFAWQDGSIGEKTADFFYPISIVEKEQILEKCKEIKPVAVTTIASDLAQITVNYLCLELGLTTNTLQCTKNSTNKFLMRKCFKEHGVPVPSFLPVDKNMDITPAYSFKYPCIVKPTDRSGSRSINKINNKDELKAAVESAIASSFEKRAIIEEFIDGDEYSCECISYKGKHNFLSLTKKFTTNAPHFIETGHLEPAGFTDDKQNEIYATISKALDALGVENGPSHSEFRVNSDGKIGIIEIGARMGGDCIGSNLVNLSTGIDFLKLTIDVACGKKPVLEVKPHKHYSFIKFCFNKADIDEMNYNTGKYSDCVVYKSSIAKVHDVVDSSSRLGYYIMSTDDYSIVKKIMFKGEKHIV